MSDVLIKNMKMPESCQMCYLFNFKNRRISEFDHDTQYMKAWSCYNACAFSKDRMVNDIRERPEWCPLIEVPPHGRLIDESWIKTTVITTLEALKKNPKMNGQEMHLIAAFYTLRVMLEDAPTVIGAEDDSE